MKKGLISVIMGIYNCESTLSEAIECILNQTYSDWEIIMCDDGSTDNTYHIAKQYADKYPDKIFLIKNEKNIGLNMTLNNCLNSAHGEFIARMDGDDLCSYDRFEKEIAVLKNNPEIAIVSCDMEYFDSNGVFGRCHSKKYPRAKDFIYGTPFCHAPCMVRKEAYDAVDGYSINKRLLRVEDYHLWIKMYEKGYKGYNIDEALYSMRDDRNAVKRRKFKYRINEAYVKFLAIKKLKLSRKYLIFVARPIIVGILPLKVYNALHKGKLS